MIGGYSLEELLEFEIAERRQEGCIVPDYSERIKGADEKELEKIYGELSSLGISPDFPFDEPEKLGDILEMSEGCTYKKAPDGEKLSDFFHAAWLGRIIGCLIGKPIECSPYGTGNSAYDGWECIKLWQEGAGDKFPPEDYISGFSTAEKEYGFTVGCPDSLKENIRFAESDDDIRYLVLGLLVNEKYGGSFTPNDIADMWHCYLTKSMVYTAEFIAMKNSWNCTESDPEKQIEYCRSNHNPFREWIGAQIRIDHYAYYNAGDPLSAAKNAYADASFSHTKNGVYGAMFFAALISAAFSEKDIGKCIQIALSVIPKKSRLYADIVFAVNEAKNAGSVEHFYKKLSERFRGLHPVHTNNNAAACVGALVLGKGDFVKSVAAAVGAGRDTDCNGATVGSFMGALLGTQGIPDYLSEPLGDTLYSSIPGFHPAKISECAERTYRLYLNKKQ